jgi:acetyltransferase-like isoleucine patch superfamily enzyme
VIRDLLAGLRLLATMGRDEREALRRVGALVAEESVAARRTAGIHPEATISPLASLRFTERVEIGARAHVGPFCCVWGGWSRTRARVGAGALLSPGVVLVAGNHRIDGPGAVRDRGFEELDVEVGDGAWIGAHAVIIGCRVGAGAVVGAGSVVTEDVPDGAIAVGVPARVVGTRPGLERATASA